MSAATSAVWRFRRARVREPAAAPTAPRRVLISARQTTGSDVASIAALELLAGRIEVLVRLEDGSRGIATLFDDGVNSVELRVGGRVFVTAHGRS